MADPTPSPAAAAATPAAGGIEADFCIIGAGSGGLSLAAAAVAFGQRVVLIEKHKMGGDCLNYGCVPSKALLASAKRAHALRSAAPFGIGSVTPVIDHRAVHRHVHEVIDAIAPNDSMARFAGLGVRVIPATAKFIDRTTVAAGEHRIRARHFVIATGSVPVVPNIPGLADVAYFTNETIFANAAHLPRLIIIGAGPIGLELAQAHRRLGSEVTVLEAATALPKDDPEMSAVVLRHLRHEGIVIREGARVSAVAAVPGGGVSVRVAGTDGAEDETLEGSHLLLAAGRRANIADLGLEAAGVAVDNGKLKVDAGLRTSNRKIFAIGDVAGGPQFTHIANDDAGIVLRRALFRMPAKTTSRAVPWVTFTDPELAHVGLTEAQARAAGHKINVLRWSYSENDRARAERHTVGHIKVVTTPKGVILGATIAGENAGEIINTWTLALSQRLKVKALAGTMVPYPTYSEISKRAAVRFYTALPSKPLVRKMIALLRKLG